MDGFLLSPGITPALTDAALVLFVGATALGSILAGRRGFILGLLVAGLVLGAIKLYTDWTDLEDDAVSVAAIGAVVFWALSSERPTAVGGFPGGLVYSGSVIAVAAGVFKTVGDFYDPFDLLLAFCAVIGGVAVGVDLYRRGRSQAPSAGSSGPTRAGTSEERGSYERL
ncbi:MAG TPA: hypothetical protein VGV89_10855 [Thermoplasmata archaeon]|nr:hypothetical protein [Thermoplasmata archaeon]